MIPRYCPNDAIELDYTVKVIDGFVVSKVVCPHCGFTRTYDYRE